ncbi:PAS domain S-box protein [Tunicatimonas pelagia]|uniref:PAS domain S-box protein n=1 Tax=Tunicatimonas pelagia TaxID=931531 RepID=UPI002666BCC6|nr:PAS domain S-box protein [Tunicatimonas pelagia]WKN41379.1 PAS domain S-box protein [Tunicatimonas pelagia]
MKTAQKTSTTTKSGETQTNTELDQLKKHKSKLEADLKKMTETLKKGQAIQQELEQAQKRSEEVLEQAVDSVVTINSDKIVTFYNKAAEQMFGYSREEVLGQNVKMIVPMEHRGNHDQYVESNMTTGENKVVGQGRNLEMVRKDGSKFWGNLSLSKVKVGDALQYTAFIKDITQEKVAKEKAEQIQRAVDTGWASIEFELDGTIISANENFLRAVGYASASEVEGKHHRIFCTPEYANSDEYGNFWSELNQGNISAGEFERVRKDGQRVWLSASYTPVRDNAGRIVKVIKIATDITKVKEPVLQVRDLISSMAQGDLTQKFEITAEGYVQEMGDALNVAMENLNGLLGSIGKNADRVGESANNLLERSKNIRDNTSEVASAISQMSKGAQDQAQRTDESSKLVDQVLSSANDMEQKANSIYQTADQGQQSCENGLLIVKNLVENMDGIRSSANVTTESINVLTERAEEIGRTLNVISDIASQTNLLALNAAIEAARAGDAGRGFAVVAEEIRKLAEDSRRSAIDIEKIISDVQKDTQSASKAIETMQVSVEDGSGATKEASTIFSEISDASTNTLSYAKEIQEATSGQKSFIDDVAKNIEQIVVVAEETAAGTEEVATSSQDLNGSVGEITEASNQLSSVAEELQKGVSKFKLRQS